MAAGCPPGDAWRGAAELPATIAFTLPAVPLAPAATDAAAKGGGAVRRFELPRSDARTMPQSCLIAQLQMFPDRGGERSYSSIANGMEPVSGPHELRALYGVQCAVMKRILALRRWECLALSYALTGTRAGASPQLLGGSAVPFGRLLASYLAHCARVGGLSRVKEMEELDGQPFEVFFSTLNQALDEVAAGRRLPDLTPDDEGAGWDPDDERPGQEEDGFFGLAQEDGLDMAALARTADASWEEDDGMTEPGTKPWATGGYPAAVRLLAGLGRG